MYARPSRYALPRWQWAAESKDSGYSGGTTTELHRSSLALAGYGLSNSSKHARQQNYCRMPGSGEAC